MVPAKQLLLTPNRSSEEIVLAVELRPEIQRRGRIRRKTPIDLGVVMQTGKNATAAGAFCPTIPSFAV